jgi:hypothetical protein
MQASKRKTKREKTSSAMQIAGYTLGPGGFGWLSRGQDLCLFFLVFFSQFFVSVRMDGMISAHLHLTRHMSLGLAGLGFSFFLV